MTVSIKTTLNSWRTALATNATIKSWSNTYYTRDHKVFVNIDSRQPPDADDCPYLLIRPTAARYGRAATRKDMEFEMVCVLHDDDLVTGGASNVTEYVGVQRVMDFLDYAIAALAAVSTGNALLQDITAEFETIEYFPYFMAGVPLVLSEPLPLTADRTTL